MGWSRVQIAGKDADIYEPDGDARPSGVVLFLHGYDGVTLRGNPAFTNELQCHNLAGLSPHGPECWWTDEIYPPFDEQVSPIEYLATEVPIFCHERWQIEPPHIGVTGIEMGGQGALQLAYRHARLFPLVVAIAPKIDFESWWGHGLSLDTLFPDREAARQRTATLHLHPLNYPKHQLLLCDPADVYCIDGTVTLASKLSSTGIPFEHDLLTSHGGFGWNYANQLAPRAIQFIASKMHD